MCFSPLTSRLESFGHKYTPSDRPWIEHYCLKFQLAQKWAGPRMLRGQLSRVPNNSWMPYVHFPSGTSVAPQTFLLTAATAIHTQLAKHYLSSALSALSVCLCCCCCCCFQELLQSTTWPHQSTKMTLERATNHIKVTCPPGLFRLPPRENVNRSTILVNSM